MNREIKFRAWDKVHKKMIYNKDEIIVETYLSIAFDGEVQECCYTQYYPYVGDFINWREKIELMQYTGLKDKNGKEIYEGDIIAGENGYKFIIKYEGSSFVAHETEGNCTFLVSRITMYEIINNIHEATEEQLKEWGIEK